MIPRPLALLAGFYAAVAAAAAAKLWKVWMGQTQASGMWFAFWVALPVLVIIGLSSMRPWARQAALWSSVLLMLNALGVAVLLIAKTPPEPRVSLMATGMAGIQLVIIRYLTRPQVKMWFRNSGPVTSGPVARKITEPLSHRATESLNIQ